MQVAAEKSINALHAIETKKNTARGMQSMHD
jgi:hypothetical protein